MRGEFEDHLREMFRAWPIIGILAALAGAGAWALSAAASPVFVATSVAQVVVQPTDRSDDGTVTEFRSRTLAELATTPAVLLPAATRSGLDIDATTAADRVRIELLDSTGFIGVTSEGPSAAEAVALADAVVATMADFVAGDRQLGSDEELRVVESAQAPTDPKSDRALQTGLLAGFVTGLLVAEGVVALRVLRGRLSPIDAAADLERATGIPTLDTRVGTGAMSFYQNHLAALPTITVFAVAEADIGVSVDLARMSAGAHDRVLIIDGDRRNPRLHRLLKVEQVPGLGEFADRRLPLGAAVRPGPLGGRVAILAAGSSPAAAASTHRSAIERAVDESGADQTIVVASESSETLASVQEWFGTSAAIVLVVNVSDGRGRRREIVKRLKMARNSGVRLASVILVDTRNGSNR